MQELPADETPEVQLFTDGACSGNPGPGGWAFILRHPATGKELESSGGDPQTTNNRMEMMAVIRGLEALKRPARVEILSDSIYVGKGLSEWLPKWKRDGWRRREGGRLKPIKKRGTVAADGRVALQAPGSFHARSRASGPRGEQALRHACRGRLSEVSVVQCLTQMVIYYAGMEFLQCRMGFNRLRAELDRVQDGLKSILRDLFSPG